MKYKSLLFALLLAVTGAFAQANRVLPEGSEIKVRTDTSIPAKPARGATFSASVSDDVMDKSGAVAIPRGSRAQLVAAPTSDGKDTVLDLRSVSINGKSFMVSTSASSQPSTPGGLGANKRTGKYVGGGAAIGAVLGALLGGGKGAVLGALAGGAGGAGAQVYQGRKRQLPAETQLSFKLAQDLELRPAAARSQRGLQKRPAH